MLAASLEGGFQHGHDVVCVRVPLSGLLTACWSVRPAFYTGIYACQQVCSYVAWGHRST